MNKLIVIITGDVCDADYVTSVNIFNGSNAEDIEALAVIRKVANVIKNSKHCHNWDAESYYDSDYDNDDENKNPRVIYANELTIDEIEIFEEYIPIGHNRGIHTIKSIQIVEAVNIENLF